MIRHLINLLLWVLPVSRWFGLRRALLRLAGIGVGRNVRVCGRGWIYGRGVLDLGDDSWVSPGVVFYTHVDAGIRIGTGCDIGPEASFVTGSHAIGEAVRRAGVGVAMPIVVGDGTWIGARVAVLGSTVVGPGSIVGAGALVRSDVPAGVLSAGVPARTIRPL